MCDSVLNRHLCLSHPEPHCPPKSPPTQKRRLRTSSVRAFPLGHSVRNQVPAHWWPQQLTAPRHPWVYTWDLTHSHISPRARAPTHHESPACPKEPVGPVPCLGEERRRPGCNASTRVPRGLGMLSCAPNPRSLRPEVLPLQTRQRGRTSRWRRGNSEQVREGPSSHLNRGPCWHLSPCRPTPVPQGRAEVAPAPGKSVPGLLRSRGSRAHPLPAALPLGPE